jgi:hypothetical protein
MKCSYLALKRFNKILLDNSLNPLRKFSAARDFLRDGNHFIKRINKIKRNPSSIRVQTCDDNDVWMDIEHGGSFLTNLSKIFGDLTEAFPALERHSQMDVVVACKCIASLRRLT